MYFYLVADVFHWDCLNVRQSLLPINTAPRGHQCPICYIQLFPNFNLVSPVADALKAYLSKVNWGRNGLGLSLVRNIYVYFHLLCFNYNYINLVA